MFFKVLAHRLLYFINEVCFFLGRHVFKLKSHAFGNARHAGWLVPIARLLLFLGHNAHSGFPEPSRQRRYEV